MKDTKHKVVVSHIPFTFMKKEKFYIEREFYADWAKLLKDTVKSEVMICGHEHELEILEPGGERDLLGHPYTVVVGGDIKSQPPTYEIIYYAGTGFVCGEKSVAAVCLPTAKAKSLKERKSDYINKSEVVYYVIV